MQTVTRALIGIVAAALAIGLVIFGVQNTQSVQIRFLNFATEQISVSLLVIGAVILGAAMMGLLNLFSAAQWGLRQRRDAKERATLAARNKELEQRVAALEKEQGSVKPAPPPEAKPAVKPVTKQ